MGFENSHYPHGGARPFHLWKSTDRSDREGWCGGVAYRVKRPHGVSLGLSRPDWLEKSRDTGSNTSELAHQCVSRQPGSQHNSRKGGRIPRGATTWRCPWPLAPRRSPPRILPGSGIPSVCPSIRLMCTSCSYLWKTIDWSDREGGGVAYCVERPHGVALSFSRRGVHPREHDASPLSAERVFPLCRSRFLSLQIKNVRLSLCR